MPVLLGLDVGTSGARALAVRAEDGEVLAEATADYELLTPRPGWTEQRPEDWWEASRAVLAQAARHAGSEVAGLGLTGQMHGSVFLDARDAVIRPALLWNDQRTARQAEAITDRVGARELLATAGNPSLTGFQAPKVLWLAEHEPEAYSRVASVLLPKDYVRLRLTGERATDAADASGTLLLDVRRRDWSASLLDVLEIPRDWLPAVHEGTEPTGSVRDAVALELGLPRGLPVAAGGGDNAAAAVGVGVTSEGRVSSSVGTSGVLFAHRDAFTPDPSGRVHAFCHALPGAFHLMAVTLSAGGSLRWWRDVAGPEAGFDALVAEAEAVPAGADGLVFLPYLSGERTPHLDPAARGAFAGLGGHARAGRRRGRAARGGGRRALAALAPAPGRRPRAARAAHGGRRGAGLRRGPARGRGRGSLREHRGGRRAGAPARGGHRARPGARAPLRRALRALRLALSRRPRGDARAQGLRGRLARPQGGEVHSQDQHHRR